MMKILLLAICISAMQLLWTGCVNPASPDFSSQDGLDEYLSAWSWLKVYYLFQDDLPKDPFAFTDPSALYNSLPDPWTQYISASEANAFISLFSTDNEAGLGIFFQVRNGKFCIIHVIPGSPADGFLIKGDTLAAVDTKIIDSTTNRDTVAAWLHGKVNTNVSVRVHRPKVPGPGATIVDLPPITRRPFTYPTVIADTLDSNVAYIALNEFLDYTTVAGGTAAELAPLLAQTSSPFRVRILDLRGNPGGIVQQCLDVCGNFLKPGDTIVRTKMRIEGAPGQGETVDSAFQSQGNGNEANKKIIVLVDDSTASAAEMLTAALQYNDSNAFVMGCHTYGKARGQVMASVDFGAIVRITFMAMTTAGGVDYNHVGLVPDTVMSNLDKSRWLEIAHNRALDWIGVAHKTTAASIEEVSNRISDIEFNRKLNGTHRTEKLSWVKRLKK
jgi:carboxyl-terminal processing protease